VAGKYRLQRRIGGGSFGAVYIGNRCGRRYNYLSLTVYKEPTLISGKKLLLNSSIYLSIPPSSSAKPISINPSLAVLIFPEFTPIRRNTNLIL